MNVVSAVFLVVFAVIGICAFVRELTFFLFRNRKNNTVMFVAPVSGKAFDKTGIFRNDKVKIQTKFKQKYCHEICRGFIRQYDKT